MPKHLVSVIIPCIGAVEDVLLSIDSIRRQTYALLEIICIDNRMETDLKELLDSLGDIRVHYYRLLDDNLNVARNYGLSCSSGDYIAMLDVGDEWLDIHIESAVSFLQSEQADGVYGSLIVKENMKESLSIARTMNEGEKAIDFLFSSEYPVYISTLLMTASSVREIAWDETLKDYRNYDFFLRYSNKFQWGTLVKPTVLCHISRQDRKIAYDSHLRFVTSHLKDFTPAIAMKYLGEMLIRSFLDQASANVYQYYLSAYHKYKKTDDNELRGIIEITMINDACTESLSLFNGKMGIAIFFFHCYRYTNDKLYERLVEELLNDIYEDVHKEMPVSLAYGLCGLGWGIEYLAQHQFIEGSTDDILDEIDRKIMEQDVRRMADISLETGLEGIAWYALLRLTSPCSTGAFDEVYKNDLLQACLLHPSRGTNALTAFLQKGDFDRYPFNNILYTILLGDNNRPWKNGLKLLVL